MAVCFQKHDGFAVLVQCLSEANIAIIIMETDDTREILRLLWHEVQAGLSCECPIVNPAADGGRLTLLVKISAAGGHFQLPFAVYIIAGHQWSADEKCFFSQSVCCP